jgi:serine/threonine-protein kinase
MEDLTGKQFGPYRILAPLGEGGMAAVYKAFQPGVDRHVAIKVLPRHYAKDPEFVERFEREAKVLARLQHPHILPVHDFGEADGGYTYIVMPFIESGDLAELMAGQKLSLREIGRIIEQIGDALDYAHTQGVVHRDVKPSNVLIDSRGNCLLTDFGLAKIVSGYTNKLTNSGFVVGTPEYMSPEQGMGEALDGRADIYALGVILYELVTERTPFSAETPVAVIFKHVNAPLLPPREIDPTLPEAVELVILKAMAKEPKDRYATAGDMVKALQAALQTAAAPLKTKEVSHDKKTHHGKAGGISLRKLPAKSPTPATIPVWQPGLDQTIIWGVLIFLLIMVMGGALLGFWWFSRSGQAAETPPTQAAQPATPAPKLELPQATPTREPQPTQTLAVQPQPTEPPATPTQPPAIATQPPAPATLPPPPQGQGQPPPPPQEAVEACLGIASGAACTANLPGGPVTGSCQLLPGQQQLACIPAGGPPPGP